MTTPRVERQRAVRHKTRKLRGIAGGVALLANLLAMPAVAVVLPDDVQEKLEQNYDAFVGAESFERVGSATVSDGFYSRQRFPDPDTTTARGVDAELNPVTKALMLVNSYEPALPRVRYRITFRLNETPNFGGYRTSNVEVTRFNLGPRLYAETVASTPKGVPVSKADFGVGPSVSWRFVMRARQGFLIMPRVARRVLTEAQAQAIDCLGVSCLATTNPTGPRGDWQKTRPPRMKPAPYRALEHGRSTAPRIAALLYRKAGDGKRNMEALPRYGEKPQLTFVISMGIEGNEYLADGLLHQGLLRDDAISDIWTHRPDWGQESVEWRELTEHWPGRN